MAAPTKTKPKPSVLLTKTARAIYEASKVRCTGFLPFAALDVEERELYDGMAAAALQIALSEPIGSAIQS